MEKDEDEDHVRVDLERRGWVGYRRDWVMERLGWERLQSSHVQGFVWFECSSVESRGDWRIRDGYVCVGGGGVHLPPPPAYRLLLPLPSSSLPRS